MAKITGQSTAAYYTALARTYPVYFGLTAAAVSMVVFTQTMREMKPPTRQTQHDVQWKAKALPAAEVPTKLLRKQGYVEEQK
ncbi:hypothetical protein P389DRAFT_168297 [Cystobasidium minutum MCA 4210]|uniref:uncharacterized protein n=1 Tax=Cystobasidium minutum MCA 4210 TaxID=1397322 RepID=UPI0034CE9D4B|eukprot:jgi/Rhomi1/168297/fgenesh1_kg.2_\